MEKQDAKDIAVFVVWSDQLGAEPRHVPNAAELMPDPRARHYWDGREVAGRAFQTLDYEGKPITLGAPAWDVWMLFDRNAEWLGASAPKPAWWEHQVHKAPKERFLDPPRFAEKARALHAQAQPQQPTAQPKGNGASSSPTTRASSAAWR